MTRVRFVSWLVLFGACCALAPAFESTASGFGRCRQGGGGVCVQYVYCPVYIEKPGAASKDAVPQVRFLMVLDILDDRIGMDVIKARGMIEEMTRMLPFRHRAEHEYVQGKDLTAANVIAAVERMEVNPGDTLVVYCNVHGVLGSSGQQLQMYNTQADGKTKELLERDRLTEALRQKPCRLKVLITDSCFASPTGAARPAMQDLFPPLRTQAGLPPEELPELKRNTPDLQEVVMRSLFLDHEGMLSMNSAAPAQYSFTRIFPEELTRLAAGFFQEGGPQPGVRVDWEYFLYSLRPRINARFRQGRDDIQAQAMNETNREAKRTLAELKEQTQQDVYVFPVPGQQRPYPDYSPLSGYLMRTRAAGGRNGDSTGTGAGSGDERADAPSPVGLPVLQAARGPSPVAITVHIQPGVNLFLENTPTKQMGAERYFQTAPLAPGQVVSYTFRAEAEVDGKKVVETQQAVCRPGQDTVIRFEKFQPAAASVASR
jgi:uncharacterized protein (TIGR03000 family)